MATSTIAVTQGSGKNIATHSFTEDAVTKELQRVVPTNSSGTEIGTGTNPFDVEGDIAHNAADSGKPVKMGFKAHNTLSTITLVDDNDRAQGVSDLDGAQIIRQGSPIGDSVSGNASNTDGANTQVIAAQGAGVKTYITDVTITNTSASNIFVELKDGTTTKWTFPVPASGGVTHSFSTPIGGTANTAWNFDPSAASTTIYCSVAGFRSKI